MLAIAAVATVTLLAAKRPITDLFLRLRHVPAQTITKSSTQKATASAPQMHEAQGKAAPETSPETSPSELGNQTSDTTTTDVPPEEKDTHAGQTQTPQSGSESHAGNEVTDVHVQELEQQRADLERARKRLAEQQAALASRQREQVQEAERVRVQQEELERRHNAELDEARKNQDATHEKQQTHEKQEAGIPVSPVAAPYSGPSSGTLTWEGEIDGADLIDIQNGAPNRGAVSGSLPGVPVMVQAFPANSVTISVAPGPSNGWKRIVLHVRAKGRKNVTATVRWVIP
jgi:hypothetical protein